VEKHIIKEYKFKNFDDNEETTDEIIIKKESNIPPIEQTSQNNIQNESQQNHEIIEKLLQKIEELSNNIINIQNKFEQQLNDCKQQIEIEKQKAYEEGYNNGKAEAESAIQNEIQEKIELLKNSIQKVDKINELFEEKILSIEKELISVALDIAKEVIQKEVSENSKEIALSLAKALMEDIKDATKITIKVNPKDAKYLKEQNLQNVEIVEDDAVKEGGVVILSDIGNIDAQILQRFKAIKEAILEGGN